MELKEHEQHYDEFWKSILENPDGTINLDQLKKELFDYSMIMQIASTVYCHITDSRVSYPHTTASVIIAMADEREQERLEEYKEEMLEQIKELFN